MNYHIGLISGTSMDGVDAAIVDTNSMKLVDAITFPYPAELKNFLTEIISETQPSYSSIIQLHRQLGSCFADAVIALMKSSSISEEQIQAIGSHGQTLWHRPEEAFPYSLQLACPHTIAERTGMTVVADFRTRDLIAEGQGAPFAPLLHEALWGQREQLAAVVNIGGIANISLIGKHRTTLGWDIGPKLPIAPAHQNQDFDVFLSIDQSDSYPGQYPIRALFYVCLSD